MNDPTATNWNELLASADAVEQRPPLTLVPEPVPTAAPIEAVPENVTDDEPAPAPHVDPTVCMHWHVHYNFGEDERTVTRTCRDCGVSGSMPRCVGKLVSGDRAGERCQAYALEGDTCKNHSPAAVAAREQKARERAERNQAAEAKRAKVTANRCTAITKKGQRCTVGAVRGTDRCMFHGGAG